MAAIAKKVSSVVAGVAMALLIASCEWESSSSDSGDTWNDSYNWINFSGTYRASDGGLLVASSGGDTQVIGTGTGSTFTFGDTLDNAPIVSGSVSVTDGNESLIDSDGDGNLSSTPGGTGTINYETGAIHVEFFDAPNAGVSVTATYKYEGGGDSGVYSITVYQHGNLLTFTTSTGLELTGYMGSVSTAGGDSTGGTDGEVVAHFEVSGGGVEITGTFQGDYTAGAVGASGTLANRVMQGTWIEAGGTGDIQGVAGSTTITITE